MQTLIGLMSWKLDLSCTHVYPLHEVIILNIIEAKPVPFLILILNLFMKNDWRLGVDFILISHLSEYAIV